MAMVCVIAILFVLKLSENAATVCILYEGLDGGISISD